MSLSKEVVNPDRGPLGTRLPSSQELMPPPLSTKALKSCQRIKASRERLFPPPIDQYDRVVLFFMGNMDMNGQTLFSEYIENIVNLPFNVQKGISSLERTKMVELKYTSGASEKYLYVGQRIEKSRTSFNAC